MDWNFVRSIVLILAVVIATKAKEDEASDGEETITNKNVMRAVVEACAGWRLNRYPGARDFIRQDLPLFHNTEYKVIGGADPLLLLLNSEDQVVERIDLTKYDKEGCNKLLIQKGFYKKISNVEDVPEEYMQGPYVPKEEL